MVRIMLKTSQAILFGPARSYMRSSVLCKQMSVVETAKAQGVTDPEALRRLEQRAHKFVQDKPDPIPIEFEALPETYKNLMKDADNQNQERAAEFLGKRSVAKKLMFKLGLLAFAIYLYTIYTVRRESFLDDLEPFPEPAPRKKHTSIFAALRDKGD